MCCLRGSTKSATMACGVLSIGLSCTNSSSGSQVTPVPHPSCPLTGRASFQTPRIPPYRRVSSVRTAARACWSSSAYSHNSRGDHHEPQRRRVASLGRHSRGRGLPEPWLPYHPSTLRTACMTGYRLSPRLAARGAHPTSGSSPRYRLYQTTDTPPHHLTNVLSKRLRLS